MSLHVYCSTPKVIVLLGFFNPEKVLVFPSQNVQFPGLHFENKALVPIHDQILIYIENYFSLPSSRAQFELDPSFAEPVRMENEDATLYLGIIKEPGDNLPRYLQTLPILIRGMNRDRSRLPYLKAWQALTGAREQDIRAVEVKS
jgi:hypothetical protein